MKELQRKAFLLMLLRELKNNGSWGGETHVQKAVYFLQRLGQVDPGFDFVLYKHGPYSFDLSDEITSMRADDYLDLEPRPYPYGPSLGDGSSARLLDAFYMDEVSACEHAVQTIAKAFDGHGVVELEAWSTALYAKLEEDLPDERVPLRVTELKPHIDIEQAKAATEEMLEIASQFTQSTSCVQLT